jgi:hypothetical protein
VEPIFDRTGSVVAWFRNGVVFDRGSRRYVAFLAGRRGHLFSYDGRYLGRLRRGWLRDRNGDAVAFRQGARGRPVLPVYFDSALPPVPLAIPVAPEPPRAPAPAAPTENWSPLSWNEFLVEEPLTVAIPPGGAVAIDAGRRNHDRPPRPLLRRQSRA